FGERLRGGALLRREREPVVGGCENRAGPAVGGRGRIVDGELGSDAGECGFYAARVTLQDSPADLFEPARKAGRFDNQNARFFRVLCEKEKKPYNRGFHVEEWVGRSASDGCIDGRCDSFAERFEGRSENVLLVPE